MSLAQELEQGIAELGLSVSAEQQQKLLDYVVLLHKWNKTYNLTAIRESQQMVSHHLLDSLSITPYLWSWRWLDVGCGAGLPGVVMAIVQPDWHVTLLDSNSKKTGFVQQAVIELGLKNVIVKCARIEDFQAVEKFDGIASRAFTELGDFLQVTHRLLAPTGRWAAMKGWAEKELATMPNDCVVEKVIKLKVPGLNAARSLVIAAQKEVS
jgi:16S rRNA (guanine527-N7)-methyltransferase